MVWAPVDDALLDGLRIKVLGYGLTGEGGELVVGGEAKGYELARLKFSDQMVLVRGEECCEAEALFETDDSILGLEGAATAIAGDQDEDDSHDDPPEMEVRVLGPVVDGDVDGETEVEQQ